MDKKVKLATLNKVERHRTMQIGCQWRLITWSFTLQQLLRDTGSMASLADRQTKHMQIKQQTRTQHLIAWFVPLKSQHV